LNKFGLEQGVSMAKIRVYEIAREVGIESKALVEKLVEMGFEVKSHASALEEFEAQGIIKKLNEHKANVVEKRIGNRVIRRRRSADRDRETSPQETDEKMPDDEAQTTAQEASQVHDNTEETMTESTLETEVPTSDESGEQPVSMADTQTDVSIEEHDSSNGTQGTAEAENISPAGSAPVPDLTEEKETPVTKTVEASKGDKAPSEEKVKETTQEKEKKKRKPKKGKDFYQATIVRRATPPPPGSNYQAQIISRPPPGTNANSVPTHGGPPGKSNRSGRSAEATPKPSGIRVLKVVPGREGRGNQFIDVSTTRQSKRKRTSARSRTDMQNVLFDAHTPGYTPSGRRRRMARRGGKKTALTTPKALKRIVKIESGSILASELSKRMGVKLFQVNRKLKEFGQELENMRTDLTLDLETASMLAQEFEHEVRDTSFKESEYLENSNTENPEKMVSRPPVVTIMGHVDHGKTSILDAIRRTSVTAEEAGGITQHIGAYEVTLDDGTITFIDTPGHEAFTAMRARGAGITDIVVLVVAADDGIMPQTIEAIHHAKDAGVPIMVAINKIDLPDSNTERIRQELTKYELVPEEWGGETIVTEVSAKQKIGLDTLLENILLQAEMLELTANPSTQATGTVIEARLDRGRGPISTLLVQSGTLLKGETILAGTSFGRIRMMYNHEGNMVKEARPGQPVQIQGLNEVPMAGEIFHSVKNEREAKRVIGHRKDEERAAKQGQTSRLSLEDFYEQLNGNEKLELKVLVKADVQGTAEAVKQSLEKLSAPKVSVKVIHHGVGAISETDVNFASSSNALLVGFNIRPDPNAKKTAQKLGLEIRLYSVIYDMTQDIRQAQEGLLPATKKESVIGRAEVRDLFVVPKIGTVAGVSVVDGKMLRNTKVRLLRDSVEIFAGKLSSLKRFKEDAKEVQSGYECGIGLDGYNDIKRGDVIEAFIEEEERQTI
jgi:translation initiation factor IF-2